MVGWLVDWGWTRGRWGTRVNAKVAVLQHTHTTHTFTQHGWLGHRCSVTHTITAWLAGAPVFCNTHTAWLAGAPVFCSTHEHSVAGWGTGVLRLLLHTN